MAIKSTKLEPLSETELQFLVSLKEKEDKTFKFGFKIIAIFCLAMPPIIAYILQFDELYLHSFSDTYIWSQVIMSIVFFIIVLAMYVRKLFYINQDIKHKQKIIESVEILQKKFMPHNETFHFYISSQLKLSIEVTEADFAQFAESDEINIEYSQYSKEYFGYF